MSTEEAWNYEMREAPLLPRASVGGVSGAQLNPDHVHASHVLRGVTDAIGSTQQ